MTPRTDRRLDLVVYGATSFVGQILCRRLVERHGTDGELRWAIAGRDSSKLDRVASETGADVERIVADASDRAALTRLVASTRVVASTVGPYALYGSVLVDVAALAGTDYCDLTGEPQWIRRMVDAHSATAASTGARLLHACGFDSIPSDLGVWHLQQRSIETYGVPCEHVSMRVASMRGGASGGTIASMVNLVEETSADPELRRQLADPYALAPPDSRTGPRQREVQRPTFDEASGQWIAPFVMAAVNTKVVHRTHALLGRPWGPGFTYDEAMLMGTGPLGAARAGGLSAAMAAGLGLVSVGPARRALAKHVLPAPGDGPSPEAQEKGSFDIRFFGATTAGERMSTRVTGDRDPGYSGTARMLAEVADCLVHLDPAEVGGGSWTPASALGDRLVERLEDHAGIRFEVI